MAATTVYPSNSGVMTQSSLSNLYNKTFDEVRMRYDSVVREGAKFFSERTWNLSTFVEGEVSSTLSLPHVRDDKDAIPLLQPTQGHALTVTKVIYKAAIAITRAAQEEQKFQLIAQTINGLPNAALRREEFSYASIFNGGFSSVTSADGSYVFATDHVQFDPEQAAWANKPTSAGTITTGSIEEARLYFDTRVNEKGFTDPQKMSRIIYPPQQWEAVQKVFGSAKYPQNALNAENPYEGLATPIMYHYLTSATAWFAQGSTDALNNGFIFVRFAPTTYLPISDSWNPDIIMGKRLRMSHGVGVLHSRNWWGNAGA